MFEKQLTTKSSSETKKFAKKIVRELLELNENKNYIICLYGNLGSGKTTFTQGLAEELKIKEVINSPTFLTMKKYSTQKHTLYHFDCYRISNQQEILDLGFEEIINSENNIIVIEWPEKIKKILPEKRLEVKFEFVDKNTRRIKFVNRT